MSPERVCGLTLGGRLPLLAHDTDSISEVLQGWILKSRIAGVGTQTVERMCSD